MAPPRSSARRKPNTRLRMSASPSASSVSACVYQGPTCSRPGLDERADARLGGRTQLQVVVDERDLSVEREAESLVTLELVERFVKHLHQVRAEDLERLVPFAIPVRVGDERDSRGRHAPYNAPLRAIDQPRPTRPKGCTPWAYDVHLARVCHERRRSSARSCSIIAHKRAASPRRAAQEDTCHSSLRFP